jgi:tetratricopeptide (TPR) repeat protein
MADLRKLIASMDKLNESTAKLQTTAKPVIAEGSMLKALNMVTKSVAPAAEMAKEFKIFKEAAESDADIDKKIEFHKQGQASAQYKGGMNKMHAAKIRELQAKKDAAKKKDVAEAAKWRADDLEDKVWTRDEETGERIPMGGNDGYPGDELTGRPGAWGGKYKRMTKKGKPTQQELGMQNNTKMRIKGQNKRGGLTGPKGPLPEGYAMDDIAVGGTVIYKSLDGTYKMSKVRASGPGMSLQLMNGSRIQNAAVVSTDQSDWAQYRDAGKMTEDSASEPDTDQILYHLTSAYRGLQQYADSYQDFSTITRIYENLRYDLKAGDYDAFQKTYENCLSRFPDASVELFDAMFVEAGLPEEQGTIEQFLEKCSGMNEANKHSFVGKIQRGHELKKKVDSTYKDIGAAQQKGDHPEASKAFRKHERYANLERPGTWTKTEEGIGDTIKRSVKNIKRGMQGWGNQGMKNMTDKETPRDLVNRNKGYDDEKVKSLSKFRKAVDQERPAPAHSPQALQNRVLDREMKKRGLGEGPAFDKNMNDRARDMLPKLKHEPIPDGPNEKWGKDMPSFGHNPEEEKKDTKFFKQAFAAPKFGVFQRGGSIGDKEPHAIKTFADKQEALAMCKRYNNLLSPGEKAYYGMKYVVRNVPAQAMDEADKHSFVGKIQRGHELKKKVDSTFKDIGAAQQKGDHPEASKAFRKHERYANLERPGTWTKVKEAMPSAVATATQKMNPGAAAPAPVAGTGAPSAPGAPTAPKVPGSVGTVDPAIAKAQQAAYQKNIAKLGLKNVNAAQAGVSMQKQADDMQMNPTDNTNNAKIAGTLANVLKDPAGAQQLKTLTDKFAKKPGQM